jgi:clan AA aspartic protease
MGTVHAEITLKNAGDVTDVRRGFIKEAEIRQTTVQAIVDTGATTLVINEEIFNKLGLTVERTRNINLAGGARMECKVTSPVSIHWKDRDATINAVMLPQGRPLLGVIPLEFMDLIVDPIRQELVGAHGDEVILMAM